MNLFNSFGSPADGRGHTLAVSIAAADKRGIVVPMPVLLEVGFGPVNFILQFGGRIGSTFGTEAFIFFLFQIQDSEEPSPILIGQQFVTEFRGRGQLARFILTVLKLAVRNTVHSLTIETRYQFCRVDELRNGPLNSDQWRS